MRWKEALKLYPYPPSSADHFSLLKGLIGDAEVEEMDAEFFGKLNKKMARLKLSDQYRSMLYGNIGYVLKNASDMGLVTNKSAKIIRMINRQIKPVNAKPPHLYEEELELWMNYPLPDRYDWIDRRDCFSLMCVTGLRYSDAYNVWEGTRREGAVWYFERPQTKGHGTLRVPIHQKHHHLVRKFYFNKDRKCMITSLQSIARHMGLTREYRQHSSTNGNIKTSIGPLHSFISTHSGRHTFAYMWCKAGFGAEGLQRILGHSSIQTTMKYYFQQSQDQLDTCVHKLFLNL